MEIIHFLTICLFIASSLCVWSCDDLLGDDLCDLEVVENSVEVSGVKMFYWIYQRASSDPGDSGLPVVMVNGGPGLPHNYMLTLKQTACSGRKIIFYDQVGSRHCTF